MSSERWTNSLTTGILSQVWGTACSSSPSWWCATITLSSRGPSSTRPLPSPPNSAGLHVQMSKLWQHVCSLGSCSLLEVGFSDLRGLAGFWPRLHSHNRRRVDESWDLSMSASYARITKFPAFLMLSQLISFEAGKRSFDQCVSF